jgi:hypothetical protein
LKQEEEEERRNEGLKGERASMVVDCDGVIIDRGRENEVEGADAVSTKEEEGEEEEENEEEEEEEEEEGAVGGFLDINLEATERAAVVEITDPLFGAFGASIYSTCTCTSLCI